MMKNKPLASPWKMGNPEVSLAARAYREIRNHILRGDLPLGGILSRRRLALEFKMSLIPVSEALQRLENEGLVESKPRIGTRVRVPTVQDVCDRYVLREALETQSARLFVEKATEQEKRELRQRADQLDHLFSACEKGKTDRDFVFSVHTCHLNFHLKIAEGSKCAALVQAIEREQVLVFNWLYDTAAQRQTLPSNFHRKLASALASGKIERADAEMRRHVRYGLKQVLAKIGGLTKPTSGWRIRTKSKKTP